MLALPLSEDVFGQSLIRAIMLNEILFSYRNMNCIPTTTNYIWKHRYVLICTFICNLAVNSIIIISVIVGAHHATAKQTKEQIHNDIHICMRNLKDLEDFRFVGIISFLVIIYLSSSPFAFNGGGNLFRKGPQVNVLHLLQSEQAMLLLLPFVVQMKP